MIKQPLDKLTPLIAGIPYELADLFRSHAFRAPTLTVDLGIQNAFLKCLKPSC